MKMLVPTAVTVLVAMASIFAAFGVMPSYVGKAKTKTTIIAPTTQVTLATGPNSAAITKKPKDVKLIPTNLRHTSPSRASETNKISGPIEAKAAGTSELQVHGGAEIKGEDCNSLCDIDGQSGSKFWGTQTCTGRKGEDNHENNNFCSRCCRVAYVGEQSCVSSTLATTQPAEDAKDAFTRLTEVFGKRDEAQAAKLLADAAVTLTCVSPPEKKGAVSNLAEMAEAFARNTQDPKKRQAVYDAAQASELSSEAAQTRMAALSKSILTEARRMQDLKAAEKEDRDWVMVKRTQTPAEEQAEVAAAKLARANPPKAADAELDKQKTEAMPVPKPIIGQKSPEEAKKRTSPFRSTT